MNDAIWIGRLRSEDAATWWRAESNESPTPDWQVTPIDDPFRLECVTPSTVAALPARGPDISLATAALLPPARPSKILCVGRNYAAHAKEMGNAVPETPLLFFKPPSCLIASGDPIPLPRGYERIDMEAELVAVIGRRARNVGQADAWDHIAGYTLGNDISNRDLQKSDKQWTRAKGFDGFGPIGPAIRLHDGPLPEMRIEGYLGEQRVQSAPVSDMIFTLPVLLEHISACMTLEVGDVIFTGTPEGVSPLGVGSVTSVCVEGFALGRLTNTVA